DLLRRADERLCVRRHRAKRVRLSRRRDERLHELHGTWRRARGLVPPARALRVAARVDGHHPLVVSVARRPHSVPPQHHAARADVPVGRAYAAIFGPIFKPLAAMPADIRAHVRYPGELFRLQTSLYATYHMVEPDAFYHREDEWQYPGAEEKGTPNATPFMRHI